MGYWGSRPTGNGTGLKPRRFFGPGPASLSGLMCATLYEHRPPLGRKGGRFGSTESQYFLAQAG